MVDIDVIFVMKKHLNEVIMSKWIKENFGYHKEYLNGFIKAKIKYSNEPIYTVSIIGNRTVKVDCESVNEATEFADKYIKDLIKNGV